MRKDGYVYILTNSRKTVLYIGVTSDLDRRIYKHRQGEIKGFSKRYNLNRLVYFEDVGDIELAIDREKQLKNWHREWKMNLIKKINPKFKDLFIED